jgi:hypothetical protein
METAASNNHLRIPSVDGCPFNEYRIVDGMIEFRALDADGKPFSYDRGQWRSLDVSDLQLHFALNTIVAQWLTNRLHTILYHQDQRAKAA